MADETVSVKVLTKRELVRHPSKVSHLKPGESIEVQDGKEPLVISRKKKRTVTTEEMFAELDRLCKDCPPMDTQAVLDDLRQ